MINSEPIVWRLPCLMLGQLSIAITMSAMSVCLVLNPDRAVGQEFRIESQVYSDGTTLPVSQNVTLFSKGLVYDFQMSDDAQPHPTETVIFDSRNRTMVLLDPVRKVRLELSDLILLKIVDGVRRETLKDERSSFLIEDDYVEEVDWTTNWLTLTSPHLVYRFQGEQPKDVTVIPPYFEFLEHFTRLIASDPTKIPPFARMKLNQSIKRLGWIPSEVHLSAEQNGMFREAFSATSKHVFINNLSDRDHARIATAKQQWIRFNRVELAEYRGFKTPPKKFKIPLVNAASHEAPVSEDRK